MPVRVIVASRPVASPKKLPAGPTANSIVSPALSEAAVENGCAMSWSPIYPMKSGEPASLFLRIAISVVVG